MKKIILLLLPVLFFMTASAAKGNSSKKMVHDTVRVMVHDTVRVTVHDKVMVTVHDTIHVHDTVSIVKVIYSKKKASVGPVSAPAQVWDNETSVAITGATVVAKDGNLTVETVSSNSQGTYSFSSLVSGKTYTFKCAKTGYQVSSKTATYNGTYTSLPEFPMIK